MKKNMSSTDSTIRFVIAGIIVVLYLAKMITGTVGLVLLILAAIFVVTGFIGFCPLYAPFGISTRKKEL